jgi:PAS domain S-box-containing protein
MFSILYVDDEPSLLEIGKLFLEQSGMFSVDTVTSAPEALLAIAGKKYDAIISDYQMPEMNGIGFLKQVRASGNRIPFIIFTGRGREEIVIQALNEGVDFYLQKGGEPVSQFAELAHKIQTAVMQRRAEASIRDHERREADIINFLPDASFAIDINGAVIAWNRAMEKMTGVPSSDILGKDNYEYAIPFYHERRPILIDLVIKDDPITAGKYPAITRDGNTLFSEILIPHFNNGKGAALWFTASPLYDTRGTVVGAIESIREITERKQVEDALHESEKRFRELSDLLPQIVFEVDINGNLMYANHIAFELFGYSEDEFRGGLTVFEMIARDDRERAAAAFRAMLEGEGKTGLSDEYLALRKDGSTFPISIYSSPVVVNNRITGLRGIIIDITERKWQEHILGTQLDLGLELQSVRGLHDTLETCLDAAIEIAGMDAGGIYLVNGLRGSLDLITSRNLGVEFLKSVSYYPASSINTQMVMAGKPIYVQTSKIGVLNTDVQEREGLKAAGIIPIPHNSRVIACLNISSHTLDEIPANARVALETIATQIGAAIESIRAEEALAESEQRYRNVVEDQTEFISRFLPDGTHIFVNEAYCRYFGLKRDEILGYHFRPAIPDEDKDKVRRFFASLTPDHPVDIIEHRILLPDGGIRWQRWSDRAIFDSSGTVTEYQSVGRDITEKKEAEIALQVTEERLRLTFEATHDGIWDWNIPTGNAVFSPHYYRMLGYEPYEFPENYASWRSLVHPDDIARGEKEIQESLNKGDSGYSIELRLRTKSGNWKWILTRGMVVERDPTGQPVRMVGTHTDISDRKKAEEELLSVYREYQTLLDQIQDVYYRSDAEGRLVRISRSLTDMLGYGDISELIGKNIAEEFYFNPEDRRKLLEEIKLLGKVTNYEVQLKRKNGTPVMISASSHLLYNPDGTIGGVEGIFRDITNQKRAEQTIRDTTNKINLLTSITRHDVANQVTILRGFAKIAMMKKPDPVVVDLLEKIDTAGSTIFRQIEFTKAYQELGMHAPGWHRIRDIIAKQQPEGISLSCTCDAEVFADPMLEKVFFNLVDNAARHGEHVTTITVTCRPDTDGLVIAVEDNGVGVPLDLKEKIFEKGYGKNTGFGLFLAREILAITSITIRETGTPRKGARFEISVPKEIYR